MLCESKHIALLALALACTACGPKLDPGVMPLPECDTPTADSPNRAGVRFKGGERLARDYSIALDLPESEVCNELGIYSCVEVVHVVPLGGVDPYGAGVWESAERLSVTTPLIVERMALSACAERVARDLSGDNLIFAGLPIDSWGRLDDVGDPAVLQAIETLSKRALARLPDVDEVAMLQSLHTQIAADGAEDAARDWATLSCFSILTSTEKLFY